MRGFWVLVGVAVVCGCIAGLLYFAGYRPALNPTYTNTPTLEVP